MFKFLYHGGFISRRRQFAFEKVCSMIYVLDSVPREEILLHVTDVQTPKEV